MKRYSEEDDKREKPNLILPNCVIMPKNRGTDPPWNEERVDKLVRALEKWIEKPDSIFMVRFCYENNITQDTLGRLRNKHPRLEEVYKKAIDAQEMRLSEMAVSRKGDVNFIKFFLAAKHGWKERTEISGSAENPLSLIMDRIAQKPQDPHSLEGP